MSSADGHSLPLGAGEGLVFRASHTHMQEEAIGPGLQECSHSCAKEFRRSLWAAPVTIPQGLGSSSTLGMEIGPPPPHTSRGARHEAPTFSAAPCLRLLRNQGLCQPGFPGRQGVVGGGEHW